MFQFQNFVGTLSQQVSERVNQNTSNEIELRKQLEEKDTIIASQEIKIGTLTKENMNLQKQLNDSKVNVRTHISFVGCILNFICFRFRDGNKADVQKLNWDMQRSCIN